MGKFNLSELVNNDKLSPMMKLYVRLKIKNQDKIIFYRLGDFYEMFFDDAVVASKVLELTLTGKDCGLDERAPMCGIPFHAAEGYIAKLIEAGYKVAICEQVEDPRFAKGLVKREIVRVVTPGTVTDSVSLNDKKNNYLCSAFGDKEGIGLIFVDVSTGELDVINPIKSKSYIYSIINEMTKYAPREMIINENLNKDLKLISEIKSKFDILINVIPQDEYDYDNSRNYINNRFSKEQIEKNELNSKIQSVNAMYALMIYLEETQKNEMKHINSIDSYDECDFAYIDLSSKRNLELTETLREKKKAGSLLGVLDRTKTAMGARLLKHYVDMPLKSPVHIVKRLDSVEELVNASIERDRLTEALDRVYDIERLASKIAYRNANGRDLISLKDSLKQIPEIKAILKNLKTPLLNEINDNLNALEHLSDVIERAISPKAPITLKEGNIIKEGFDSKLDELRNAGNEGKKWILQIESEEKEKTGIKNLKVGYNKVFGYYIEVTKSFVSMVPDYFIRKQTLANCERYITEKLKEIENLVIGASEKSINLEYEIFCEVREKAYDEISAIQNTARALSKLDVLCSFAEVAYKNHYVKPVLSTNGSIVIKDGRHPVVENMLSRGAFIANDTYLNQKDNSFAIITGPNMAGKSTYMRQVALICVMCQIGSFVPAKSANLSIVDKIFTRVGASDDLASGQSTFMVEMNEVSNILKNATEKSLVILDEIGRGTSTFDGLSIAWSVVEYILRHKKCKTLFATHYHELIVLEEKLKGVKNYQIAVKKRGDDITFLRKIIEGGTDDSFGIEVAKLAGLPDEVIKRAKEIVKFLESKNLDVDKINLSHLPEPDFADDEQVEFCNVIDNDVMNILKSTDVSVLTPIEALNILDDLCKRVKEI